MNDVPLDPRVAGLPRSATLAIQERCTALAARGLPIARLGLGQSPFPVPGVVVEALRAHAPEKAYLPVQGLPLLREAVSDHMHRRHGVAFGPKHVMVGPGSKELLFLMQLSFDGELVIPAPAWVSYEPQARIAGRHVTRVRTSVSDGFRIHPEELARAFSSTKKRPMFLLNAPSNPTGTTLPAELLAELAEVCRAHEALIISDEIYADLQFDGGHTSIARFAPERTIISSGLSKWCGAGGWRLGTMSFPPQLAPLLEAMAALASETFSATSAPIQYAAVTAFRGGSAIESYLATARRILARLGRRSAAILREAGAAVQDPTAAFYLFPSFAPLRAKLAARGLTDDRTFCEALLEATGVAILPGSEFGMGPDDLYVRIALVDFDGARALELAMGGQPVDDAFIDAQAAPVLDAIRAMAAFLRG